MSARPVSPFVYLGVFLVSAVALGLEILMTRILALMMWHHLTYVVIGVALLGFGAAGSRVMVRSSRSRAEDRATPGAVEVRLARATLGLALAVPLAYAAMIHVPIEPLALAEKPVNFVALLAIYLLIAVPFYFGGLAICDAIGSFSRRVGSIYFVDLLGAGVGVVLAVVLIEPLTGPGALLALASLAALGAASFALASGPGAARRAVLAVAAAALLGFAGVPYARSGALDPPLAPEKEMALGLAAARERGRTDSGVDFTAWNPLARIDVGEVVNVRPLMGGSFPPDTPQRPIRIVFQDGSAPTLMVGWDAKPERLAFLQRASAAAGHVALRARGVQDVRELAIGVGGGIDLLIGLQFGVKLVTGAEINRSTVHMLSDLYDGFTGGLVARDDVELVNAEGRHYARASGRTFDLIQMSGVDTYTALSTGAYTLSESYLYTKEGVLDFVRALSPRGVVCYSRIVFMNRPRETLRLAATAAEALEELGVAEPWRNLYLLGSGSWASLVISRSALEPEVLAALRKLASENEYRVLFDPAQPRQNAFDDCLRRDAAGREAFYAGYPFLVRPATDDRPFFFNYYRWRALFQETNYGGHAYSMTYPMGNLCLAMSLLQTVVLGAFFIFWPLRRLRGVGLGRTTRAALAYFSALGVGFIAVEVVLMQQLVLFLGHPTYSLVTVLPTMLIAAGLGSLTVRPSSDPLRRVGRLAVAIPLVIVAGWLAARYGLDALLHLGLAGRIAVAVALLAPIGFVLGMAFPSGVQLLDRSVPELVPWAWAVNAFTTVLGSTATVLVAMEVGFSVVLLATVPIYLLGILALRRGFARAPAAA